ncbi:MAG: tetratricopeptide repeat protein [Candidatus Eisenbacteria bacterium]|uniref:Tetratricopeptide repeat protein n=1 Tax=Eiseniibacteriota bacterium TaxID=2212470 RepID=A0A933SI71_UNCEI|nr:tetratricopeptide repeat protein [Candidatus Eisenbacteria bacterium]
MSADVTQQQIDQLLRLEVGDDVWQVRVLRLADWLELRPEDRERSLQFIARSSETGRLGLSALSDAALTPAGGAFEALLSLARSIPGARRPVCVEAEDEALFAALGPALDECGIACRLEPHLSDLDEPVDEMREELTGRFVNDPLYRTISSERLRSFADAVALFHERRPWSWLGPLDIVQVESPTAKDLPAWFTVNGGAGEHFGLAMLFDRRTLERLFEAEGMTDEQMDRLHFWSVGSDEPRALSIADARRWREESLPVVTDGEIPFAAEQRPGADFAALTEKQLAYAEAVLRAVSLSTEDEVDAGRWERAVEAAGEPVLVRLAMPVLLEHDASPRGIGGVAPRGSALRTEVIMRDIAALMAEQHFESPEEAQAFIQKELIGKRVEHRAPSTPAEIAQDLAYEAYEYEDRRRIRLARRALEAWPDCADAYLILAEDAGEPERAFEFFTKAVEAGERAIGKRHFEKYRGHFWGVLETRPYMRARLALADFLEAEGRLEEAVGHYHEMLELCPGDNLGVRHRILPLLLEAKQFSRAREVYTEFEDDIGAGTRWAHALLEFAEHGDSEAARAALAAAKRANPGVLKYLTGTSELPDLLPDSWVAGRDSEAQVVSDRLIDAFDGVAGAVEWLKQERKQAKKAGKAKRRKH